MRECLYLGGYSDDELNIVPNQKHTWRTKYVEFKDRITLKVKLYDASFTARNKISWRDIHKFVRILEGDDDDRFQKVFGEHAHLLPEFLEAAEERASQGIFEKELGATNEMQPSKKRAHAETTEHASSESDDDEKLYTISNNPHDHAEVDNGEVSAEEGVQLPRQDDLARVAVAEDPLDHAEIERDERYLMC